MEKGFTLLEIVVVLAIASILGTATIVSFSGAGTKNALREIDTRVPLFFENYINNSFDTGIRYKVVIEFRNKKIKIYDRDMKYILEELKLNNNLVYERKGDEESDLKEIAEDGITEEGNFSRAFTIMVKKKNKEKVFRKITGDNTLAVRFGKMRVYIPVNGEYVQYNMRNKYERWKLKY